MRQKSHVTKMKEGAEKAEETIQRIYEQFKKERDEDEDGNT